MSRTPDLSGIRWATSSHSSGEGGMCVAWAPAAHATHGLVPVRDSKDPRGPALIFGPAAWSSFVRATRNGELTAG